MLGKASKAGQVQPGASQGRCKGAVCQQVTGPGAGDPLGKECQGKTSDEGWAGQGGMVVLPCSVKPVRQTAGEQRVGSASAEASPACSQRASPISKHPLVAVGEHGAPQTGAEPRLSSWGSSGGCLLQVACSRALLLLQPERSGEGKRWTRLLPPPACRSAGYLGSSTSPLLGKRSVRL